MSGRGGRKWKREREKKLQMKKVASDGEPKNEKNCVRTLSD